MNIYIYATELKTFQRQNSIIMPLAEIGFNSLEQIKYENEKFDTIMYVLNEYNDCFTSFLPLTIKVSVSVKAKR